MLYDIIFLGIIVLTVILGICKGAAESLLSLCAFFASIILSLVLSRPLAVLIFNVFIKANIESKIAAFVVESYAGSLVFEASAFLASIPGVILNLLNKAGVASELQAESAGIPQTPEEATSAVAGVISPVIIGLIRVILVVLLFIILRLLLGLLAKLLAKIFELPLLRIPDAILGGVLGLLKGALIVVAVCLVLNLLSPLLAKPLAFLYDSMNNSKVAVFIWEGKILSLLDSAIYRI